MRIVFLSYSYERGLLADAGGFRKLWELAWALQGLGHEVSVFYPALPGFTRLRDVPCRAFPVFDLAGLRPLTAYLSMFGAALAAGRRSRADVVYFRTGLNVLPVALARALRARAVLEVNADPAEFLRHEGAPRWRQALFRAAERLNVRACDLVVALTPGLKRSLVERYGVPESKVRVIPSGTDPEHFVPLDPGAAKTRLGLPAGGPVVGFVGLFYRHQGIHTLIEAAPLIVREVPGTRFLLVGDGAMRPAWEALARRLGVAEAVTFTGQIPYREVPPCLGAMDVVVAPFTADRGETSPFKVLDALAGARPVVASDLPSVRQLAEACEGAVTLVPPGDAPALATAVLGLLRDPARAAQLGGRGRAVVVRDYGWDASAARLEQALERVDIARRPAVTLAARPWLGRAGRGLASWAPLVGAVPRPAGAPGLSAIVRVKDEEEWLAASLRSLREVADEILVGDNGSVDRTAEILRELQRELPDQLRVFARPDLDIRDLTNFLIGQARFRWVIRWDADFVARTQGPYAIRHFREWLEGLDSRRYAFVYVRMIELCGDLFHQRPASRTRADCHCWTASPRLRYVYDRTGYEAPRVPRWYRVLRYEVPTFFHVDVKPSRRMFLSFLWKRYLTDPARGRARFETHVEQELRERWDGKALEEAAVSWAASVFRDLVPYDRDRFGEYPTGLKPFLETPRYRLLYADGRIVGRAEPESRHGSAKTSSGAA